MNGHAAAQNALQPPLELASRPVGSYISANKNTPDVPQPKLFAPLKLPNGLEICNRLICSPMCMYTAYPGTGMPNAHHIVHLGGFALRGMSLVIAEATSVLPNGRISPTDLGIWSDEHIAPFKQITDYIRTTGNVPGIQIAHAGRKASTRAPWSDGPQPLVRADEHGWENDIWGASAIPFAEGYGQPLEMTLEQIKETQQAFVDGAKRSYAAGMDFVELHGAHGYLISTFLSPTSNKRTDQYGGSLENRMRFLLEMVDGCLAVRPSGKALAVRISGDEWHPEGEKAADGSWHSWGIEQSIILAKELHARGIDLLDVSSGGIYQHQVIKPKPGYQTHLAEAIKKAVPDLIVSSVGLITSGKQAEEILQAGQADVIMLARELLRNADFAFDAAIELDSVIQTTPQYARAYTRMQGIDGVRAIP